MIVQASHELIRSIKGMRTCPVSVENSEIIQMNMPSHSIILLFH